MKKTLTALTMTAAVILTPVVLAQPAQARPIHDQPVYSGPCEGRYEGVFDWRAGQVVYYCNTTPRHQLLVRRPPVWWNPWTWG